MFLRNTRVWCFLDASHSDEDNVIMCFRTPQCCRHCSAAAAYSRFWFSVCRRQPCWLWAVSFLQEAAAASGNLACSLSGCRCDFYLFHCFQRSPICSILVYIPVPPPASDDPISARGSIQFHFQRISENESREVTEEMKTELELLQLSAGWIRCFQFPSITTV